MTQKSIRFPAELADKIQAIAEAEDRAFSYVVVRAMERAFGDATGDRIPERPAPPRSTSPKVRAKSSPPLARPKVEDYEAAQKTGRFLDDEEVVKRAKAIVASRPKPASAALARQQALNKSKGI